MSVNSLSKLLFKERLLSGGDKRKCEKEREARMVGEAGAFNSSGGLV